jgi:hypothetical protein
MPKTRRNKRYHRKTRKGGMNQEPTAKPTVNTSGQTLATRAAHPAPPVPKFQSIPTPKGLKPIRQLSEGFRPSNVSQYGVPRTLNAKMIGWHVENLKEKRLKGGMNQKPTINLPETFVNETGKLVKRPPVRILPPYNTPNSRPGAHLYGIANVASAFNRDKQVYLQKQINRFKRKHPPTPKNES